MGFVASDVKEKVDVLKEHLQSAGETCKFLGDGTKCNSHRRRVVQDNSIDDQSENLIT